MKTAHFSSDNESIACCPRSNIISIFKLKAAEEPVQIKSKTKNLPEAIAISASGRLLAVALEDGTIEIWNPKTRRVVGVLPGRACCISFLAFSPDGKRLAAANQDTSIFVWDVSEFEGSPDKKP